jgi:hypothetical protein
MCFIKGRKYHILPGPEKKQAEQKEDKQQGIPDFFHRGFLRTLI